MPKARIDSLEVLKSFRTTLWKFSEMALAAMADAEGEIHRTLTWLDTEQLSFWETQIRKRHDWVEKCKDAYRQKTLFKDAAGHRYSGFDERKALDKAQRSLEEAEEKFKNVKRNVRLLQKELQNYTGAVQRLSTDVLVELPNTIAKIEKMEMQLEHYVALAAPETTGATPVGTTSAGAPEMGVASMSRGAVPDAGPSVIETADDLRNKTPGAPLRLSAHSVTHMDSLISSKPINGAQRLAIAALDLKRNPTDLNQTITICADITDPANIYLHRTAPANAQDSGWFIGPAAAEAPINDLAITTIEHLLILRPDLREIIALPVEFLVLICPQGIKGVYNSKGQNLWGK